MTIPTNDEVGWTALVPLASIPCGTLGLVGIMLFVAAKLVVHSAKYRIS
jgi:hypothetical protein